MRHKVPSPEAIRARIDALCAQGRITQMKEGTVKSHLSRGKEKLANYLRQNGYDRR
jgi:hypothetical protein